MQNSVKEINRCLTLFIDRIAGMVCAHSIHFPVILQYLREPIANITHTRWHTTYAKENLHYHSRKQTLNILHYPYLA